VRQLSLTFCLFYGISERFLEQEKMMVHTTALGSDIDPKSAQNALLNDEVRVYVDYTMPRDQATLETKFSKHGVGAVFYNDAEWQLHPSCIGMDQTPGERAMLLKWFNRRISSENAIAEMDTLGYRPATHLEAYAIAKANPELQRLFWIAALGSFAIDGNACVAVLISRSSQLVLRAFPFSVDWGEDQRFLFVRK
jgi:hypothetical protein